ncbi:MAG: hypothetical protein K2J09_02005, partial [Muribaculaceae bacterium]|nr:hypothetical protein [Muribaculaceae bacterium]
LLAEPVFILLYTDEWAPAAPYFRVFCCGGFFVALQHLNFYAVAALGHSRTLFRWSFYKWGVLLVLMLIGMNFGMYGMLWALVASNINIFMTNSVLAARLVGFLLSAQVRALLPVGGLTVLVAALCWLFQVYTQTSPWLMVPLYVVLYFGIAYMSRARALNDLVGFVRSVIR